MPTGIELSAGIVVGAAKPIDAKFGPYATTAAALADIPAALRYKGLTVGIETSGQVAEYWFRSGTADSDFVQKNPTSSFITGSGVASMQVVTALPATPSPTTIYLVIPSGATTASAVTLGSVSLLTGSGSGGGGGGGGGDTLDGGGGGGGTFTPKSVAGLKIWLDATTSLYNATTGGSLVTSDGSAVARWEDQSGNGFHATQATNNNRPILKTSILNGKNVLRLDGLNDWYIIDHEVLLNSVSIFAVFRNSGLNQRLLDQRGTGATGSIKGWHLKPRNTMYDGFTVDSADGAWISKADAVDANFHICAALYGGGISNYYIDGVLKNTFPDGNGTIGNIETTKRIYIGANLNGQNSQIYSGDIGELIIYDSGLTTAERQQVESYLSTKWGIAI